MPHQHCGRSITADDHLDRTTTTQEHVHVSNQSLYAHLPRPHVPGRRDPNHPTDAPSQVYETPPSRPSVRYVRATKEIKYSICRGMARDHQIHMEWVVSQPIETRRLCRELFVVPSITWREASCLFLEVVFDDAPFWIEPIRHRVSRVPVKIRVQSRFFQLDESTSCGVSSTSYTLSSIKNYFCKAVIKDCNFRPCPWCIFC